MRASEFVRRVSLSGVFLLTCLQIICVHAESQKQSQSQIPKTVRWDDCVKLIQTQGSSFKAAEENLSAAELQAQQAWSGFLPQVTAGLGYSKSDQSTGTSSYTATLNATQNIFSGFADVSKLAEARLNRESSQYLWQLAKSQALYDLKNAFHSVITNQNLVTLSKDIVRRRKDNLKLVELRFEGGRENKGSVYLSRSYLAQANLDVLTNEHNLESSIDELKKILGLTVNEDIRIDGTVPVEDLPKTRPHFLELLQSNPTHLQSLAEQKISSLKISAARANFLPSLVASGQLTRQDSSFFPNNQNWSIGLSLSIPLFNGGRDYFSYKSAQAQAIAAEWTTVANDGDLYLKLKKSFDRYQEATEKLNVDESFLSAAMVRAEVARNKYNNGLLSFDEWDLIENDLINRQKAVLNSQRERVLAATSWELSQGKGVLQ